MTLKEFIKRYLSTFLLVLAVVFALASVFVPSASYDTAGMAEHVSKRVDERVAQLDHYSQELLGSAAREGEWPELKGFPDDMVIYRYAADTLHSWYNRFGIIPTLDNLSELPSYRNYGRRWYVVKLLDNGKEKIVEGLLIKDDDAKNPAGGQNGISKGIHLHGKYDIASMDAQDGAVVRVCGEPLFKVVVSSTQTSNVPLTSAGFRWLALLMLVLSGFGYLALHRSTRNCLYTMALVCATAILAQFWGSKMADYTLLFSPVLYAHDGLLSSFGSLLIINAAVFLCILAIFMCRDFLACSFSSTRRSRICYVVSLALLCALVLEYIFYTLSSIVMNSAITLELYRINIINWYTFIAYFSYSFVIVSVLLLVEVALTLWNGIRGTGYSVLKWPAILGFSAVASALILMLIMVMGFQKEENRVEGWSNRLAVDRDLRLEMSLREMEKDIQADEVLDLMSRSQNAERLIVRRLEDAYFGSLPQQCAISVVTATEVNQELRLYMESIVEDGVSIGPGSHFLYNKNSSKGSFYTGVFSYYSKENGLANLVVEVVPRFSQSVQMPPTYSFAKYENGRLSSFNGNFAYPTVLDGLIVPSREGKKVFVSKGYRHFVNRISDEETIVISRREERYMSYFITFTYLLFMLCIIASLFRHRSRVSQRHSSYFSVRMLTLVIVSLTVTLVVMASVSVWFVYQRNERNMSNTMSSKISTIQIMMDAACRQVNGPEDMQDRSFMRTLDEISRNANTPIDLYSPQGQLLISNSNNARRRGEVNSLLPSEVYRNIVLDHQRYHIAENPGGRFNSYMMYAPVINAAGNIVAITASPYMQRDYDFTRDAVFHAATVISLFIILLFITVLIASSIIRGIFHPLVQMGERMKGTDAQNLEQISYDGDDEISSLVVAYNTMVNDLKESTGKLAAAERDKAWSEMARQVAHEIKNPLTPIKLEIQRLQRLKQRNAPGWEEKFDNVSAVILEHIDILSQTANEFSTFAKLYSEPSTPINLDKTLREQIMLFENRGVQITYLGADDVTVMGPKPQLIRVFVNLLTNALQAVENVEAPHVMVSLRKGSADGTWDIVVEDNGPGVSEENQDKLFTPNFTTKSSGTGLGLAICRSIVDRCGGSISYSRSFTLGGACFTVSLPA